MDLPPELKHGVFLLLTKNELKIAEKVFPETANDSYFKAHWHHVYSTFIECSAAGLTESCKLHLKSTDNVNCTNKHGWTPLHAAVRYGHDAIVQLLLDDPMIEVNPVTAHGSTPLHVAARNGHHTIVQLLLTDERVDPNLFDSYEWTPLYLAIQTTQIDSYLVVQQLLSNPRVDPNLRKDNEAPLHIATRHGNIALVKLFLNNPRVDINLVGSRYGNNTPLRTALFHGHEVVAKLLRAAT